MKKTAFLYIVIQFTIVSFSFAQTKVCYIWVTDHWERPRANVKYHPDSLHCFEGQPPAGPQGGVTVTDKIKNIKTITETVVVMPGNTTSITIQETATEKNFVLTSAANMLPADQQLWNKAVNNQLGIIANDYRGYEDIGSACFERAAAAVYIPNNLNFWFPQSQTSPQPTSIKYYKRTLVGKVDSRHRPEVQNIREQYEDFDVNVFVKPDPAYQYLLREAHPPQMSTKQFIKEIAGNASIRHPWETTINGCPGSFTGIETEIQLGNDAKEKFMPLINQKIERPIGVYGPWIWDEGHCCQPEIHPSEQIWWSDKAGTGTTYTCNVFCDASKRFWWRSQMDDGTKIKPWGAPPIKGVFAIAFEVSLGNGITANSGVQKVFEVNDISYFNVRDYLTTDNIHGDKVYNLNYQGKNIVSFIPHNNSFKVSFEKVGLVPAASANGANLVRGFLVIETEVGTCILKNKRVNILNPVYTANSGLQQYITVTVPDNADVNKVSEEIEKKAFEKIDGHYMFKVTETVKGGSLSTGTMGKIN